MRQASPVRWCDACRIRYSVGSRMLMFGDAMSILARSTREPSANSPARMRRNRSRFSASAAIAVRAVRARLGQRAAVGADLVGRQIVDVRLAHLNELLGVGVHLLEVVGGEEHVVVPVESRASGHRSRSTRRTRCPPSSGWCRPSAGCTSRRTPRRRRSSGRWPWRGRCAGSRSVPGGKRVWTRPPCLPAARSATMISRMKSLASVSVD